MNRAIFYSLIRPAPFGGSLTQPQVDGINAILDEWDRRKLSDVRWLAYMLATTFHETARQMQPIAEFGGPSKAYSPYYGRGFVQITWRANYLKLAAATGVDVVTSPVRALELPVATVALFDGMIDGWFTGSRLADYISGDLCDYIQARRIVNGTDRAVMIAGYAVDFAKALAAAAAAPASPANPPAETPALPSLSPDDPGVDPTPAPPQPTEPAMSANFFKGLLGTLMGFSGIIMPFVPAPYQPIVMALIGLFGGGHAITSAATHK